MTERQQSAVAYRLGWALYWFCLALAACHVVFFLMPVFSSGLEEMLAFRKDQVILALLLLIGPALLAYGVGRFLRYVLAGD
jgi:hypothetical protein